MIYQIRIKGYLDKKWSDWFAGMTISLEENDEVLISGEVIDQSALHGLLKQVRDLGLPLISVNPIEYKEKIRMKTYRMNALMAGSLYFLGTVFGVTSALVGGKVLSSVVSGKSLSGLDLLGLVTANSSQLNGGLFLYS
jgi:hypothetical protein